MMQSCNGTNGGSHVIRVGRWCIVFLAARSESGTDCEEWVVRVERLPTLPTRDRTRATADFLLLMGGQDGLVKLDVMSSRCA
jgi:hypothetical protein